MATDSGWTCRDCGADLKVGERIVYGRDDSLRHSDCPPKYYPCDDGCGKLHTFPPDTLSLLVLDMGDCCVVKVESGQFDYPTGWPRYLQMRGSIIVDWTFGQLRAALDGEKPVPRIEDKNGFHNEYTIVSEHGTNRITRTAYNALSQLAGHPLPIWEGNGKWTNLIDDCSCNFQLVPFGIWRYSR